MPGSKLKFKNEIKTYRSTEEMIIAKYDIKLSASFEILSLIDIAVTYPEVFWADRYTHR